MIQEFCFKDHTHVKKKKNFVTEKSAKEVSTSKTQTTFYMASFSKFSEMHTDLKGKAQVYSNFLCLS